MVYFISSPQYQPMILKILTETGQICVGSNVGQDIYFKKHMKENIMMFEQVDILLIDFTALADTDEEVMEAIESLRIMDFQTRIIIVAPYKQEGDPFLKKCFYAGIYDIIISDEYLELSQTLAHCITTGMRYKDALKYRDSVPDEVEHLEKQIVQKVLIGVCAAGPRMGSTHNSIVLANMLRENNQMVALLEMNNKKAFETICEAQNCKVFEEGYFSIKGVDFYPSCSREKVIVVSGKLYNFIILDFGNYEGMDKVMYNRCDIRMVFCGTKSWELPLLEKIFKEQDEDVLKKYHFCFLGTTSTYLQKEIQEHMDPLVNIWFPEYTEEPTNSTRFPEGVEILKEYLVLDNCRTEKKKKRFGFRRKK